MDQLPSKPGQRAFEKIWKSSQRERSKTEKPPIFKKTTKEAISQQLRPRWARLDFLGVFHKREQADLPPESDPNDYEEKLQQWLDSNFAGQDSSIRDKVKQTITKNIKTLIEVDNPETVTELIQSYVFTEKASFYEAAEKTFQVKKSVSDYLSKAYSQQAEVHILATVFEIKKEDLSEELQAAWGKPFSAITPQEQEALQGEIMMAIYVHQVSMEDQTDDTLKKILDSSLATAFKRIETYNTFASNFKQCTEQWPKHYSFVPNLPNSQNFLDLQSEQGREKLLPSVDQVSSSGSTLNLIGPITSYQEAFKTALSSNGAQQLKDKFDELNKEDPHQFSQNEKTQFINTRIQKLDDFEAAFKTFKEEKKQLLYEDISKKAKEKAEAALKLAEINAKLTILGNTKHLKQASEQLRQLSERILQNMPDKKDSFQILEKKFTSLEQIDIEREKNEIFRNALKAFYDEKVAYYKAQGLAIGFQEFENLEIALTTTEKKQIKDLELNNENRNRIDVKVQTLVKQWEEEKIKQLQKKAEEQAKIQQAKFNALKVDYESAVTDFNKIAPKAEQLPPLFLGEKGFVKKRFRANDLKSGFTGTQEDLNTLIDKRIHEVEQHIAAMKSYSREKQRFNSFVKEKKIKPPPDFDEIMQLTPNDRTNGSMESLLEQLLREHGPRRPELNKAVDRKIQLMSSPTT